MYEFTNTTDNKSKTKKLLRLGQNIIHKSISLGPKSHIPTRKQVPMAFYKRHTVQRVYLTLYRRTLKEN